MLCIDFVEFATADASRLGRGGRQRTRWGDAAWPHNAFTDEPRQSAVLVAVAEAGVRFEPGDGRLSGHSA